MMLKFLYETAPGRVVLKVLTMPILSEICGKFLDSKMSTFLIPSFVKKNRIRMRDYEEVEYKSFNEFFCRKIKEEKRPVNMNKDSFISPCDGLLSVYPITDGLVIPVKRSLYRISDLLQDKELADKYQDGTCLVFRLCVNHYHRYAYVESGEKTENYFIPGVLHTVRPIALRNLPVFTENAREYTVIHTENFGDIVQMEVGAMLVGKIKNHKEAGSVCRGEEKGYFVYGGSTVIVLLEKDQVHFSSKLYEMTKQGREYPVRLGQRIGKGQSQS